MERVSTFECGKNPVIFVVPHCEDLNISIIAKQAAEAAKGYYVINNGWQNAQEVDQKKDKANCNNVKHCHYDVVKEEFLEPIIRFKNRILKKHKLAYILYLHGINNDVRKRAGDDNLGYVIGYGAGKPQSYTTHRWVRDCFIYNLAAAETCHVFVGEAGGRYAAWAEDNMNQLFQRHYSDEKTESMQVSIIKDLRDTDKKANATGEVLAMCIEEVFTRTNFEYPSFFKVKKL